MKNLLAALLFSTALLSAQSVKHIHRIYVNEMHFPSNPDWDGIVRSKLISSLVKDCGSGCTVIEENGDNAEDMADGVLTGAMVIQTDNGRYRVQGAMRLVAKDGSVVWADTVYSSPFAHSASTSFADNTAKRLTTFLAQAKVQ
jgi:hypothetical protein